LTDAWHLRDRNHQVASDALVIQVVIIGPTTQIHEVGERFFHVLEDTPIRNICPLGVDDDVTAQLLGTANRPTKCE
jgi:hypothetical protein